MPKARRMLFALLLGLWLLWLQEAHALAITNGHCQKNISVKYQVPVTRSRANESNNSDNDTEAGEQFIVYEERVRWDTVQVCCPGYRTIIFGFCEPICTEPCPTHSYCVEPNKCHCLRGYEQSHHANRQHQLICRPICLGGCPEHSHCVAHNECECRVGYKDVSSWFAPLRCQRIQCGPDQRYDVARRACVKIEMSMEELMQRVADRLAHGLDLDNESERPDRDEMEVYEQPYSSVKNES
ncbi:uncharacterized protein LOC115626026 [Scaptodrosophila lebanonensis]|uniref:Uncharacterized protein LOC115626026 n=1 Tax=Drosophila lebanonensis TaxID=7225 RepID=A0A6J2TKI0_DROLE|nr:uncharacterized protein LOC115626026 [Scaptodrosophila lebanonensis]